MRSEDHPTREALIVWLVFIVLNVAVNGTIPFLLGHDLRAWSESPWKLMLVGFVGYGLLFTVVPLVLIKGWATVRQPAFLFPLCVAVMAMTLFNVFRGVMFIAVLILAFLHWRFDLSDYGIRWRDWRADAGAALLIGLLAAVPALLGGTSPQFDLRAALIAGMDRWFANPASTVENLFYYGFLAERISRSTGTWITALSIAAMYTAHEMSNPEYWYEGLNFGLIFVGVGLFTLIYLWRRSVVPIWIGDGLARLLGRLL